MKIFGREVGPCAPPLIIAELSANHKQDLSLALEMVESAAQAGADAIKLQTYLPDTITLDSDKDGFVITDSDSLWFGRKLYDLYQEAHTPWEWHRPIFERAKSLGLSIFSSPFDESAVDFLESLDCPAYKIASFEINHIPLIEKAASTGKPIIMSCGMASVADISLACDAAVRAGCDQIALLKCTSSYPSLPVDANVLTIENMRQTFGLEVGLSDHTLGLGVAIASVARGASIVEKHFTLSRDLGGLDAPFSLEPNELKALVDESKSAWESLGVVKYGSCSADDSNLKFRRSIYASKDIASGDLFSAENIRVVRPGFGAHPKHYKSLIGMKSPQAFAKGSPLILDYLFD